MMRVLLTGPPRCGKTTLVERVVEGVRGRVRLAGFFTSEVRDGGDRSGFDVVALDGRRGVLSRKGGRGGPRVGSYSVDLGSFERIGVAALQDPSAEAFVIDEIGLMELHSRAFKEAVTALLDGPRPVLATIRYKSEPFCDSIKARPEVELIVVSQANRDGLVGELAGRLLRECGKA
jgi:nucleoside-triphosphatase